MILAITVSNFLNVYVHMEQGGGRVGGCCGCSLKAMYVRVCARVCKCVHVSNFMNFGIFLSTTCGFLLNVRKHSGLCRQKPQEE